jgi:superfamily I DNA/RNA helicase
VFVMGLDLMLENKKRLAEEVRLLVTGITRSGEELFVCAGGGGAVADAVAAAVAGD